MHGWSKAACIATTAGERSSRRLTAASAPRGADSYFPDGTRFVAGDNALFAPGSGKALTAVEPRSGLTEPQGLMRRNAGVT
jgi:hypothetical protein